jgi:hypothetical protein
MKALLDTSGIARHASGLPGANAPKDFFMRAADFIPENERERMAAVKRYDVLDTPPDGAFDRITSLAARRFGVPISFISIVMRIASGSNRITAWRSSRSTARRAYAPPQS